MKKIFLISLTYLIFSSLWIFLTDSIDHNFFGFKDYTRFQTYKGILFVVFSSLVVFLTTYTFYIREILQYEKVKILSTIQEIILNNSQSFSWICNLKTGEVILYGYTPFLSKNNFTLDITEIKRFYQLYTDFTFVQDVIEDLKRNKIETFEHEYKIHLDNDIKYYKIYFLKYIGSNKNSYIIAHSNNITEYRKSLEEIEHQQKLLDSVIKSLPDILILIDNKTYVVKFFYYKDESDILVQKEYLLGKDIRHFVPPFISEELEKKIQDAEYKKIPFVYALPMHNRIEHYEARFVDYDSDNTMIIVRNITEQYETNREKEIYLQQLQNAESILNFAFWSYDTEDKKKYVSSRISTLFGITINSIEDAKMLFEYIVPEDLPFAYENYKNILEGNELKDGTIRFKLPDGNVKHILQKVMNIRKGKFIKYQGVLVDITNEILTAINLKQKSFYLNLLSEFTNDILVLYDFSNEKIEYINSTAFKYIIKEDFNDVKSNFFQGYFYDKDLIEIKEKIKILFNKNDYKASDSICLETQFIKEKRVPIWVEVSIYKIADEDSDKILLLIKDIHEKKKYLEELENANLQFRYAAKATTDAIWDWNLETGTFIWTENFEIFFGHNIKNLPKDLSGWKEFCHPDDIDRVFKSIRYAIDHGHEFWQEEYRLRDSSGIYKDVLNKAVLIYHDNKAVRIIGAIHDITKEKDALRKLTMQNLKLREIAWTQSHVVRAPLARLMGLIEMYDLLRESEYDDVSLRKLIYNSAKELDDTIHHIIKKTENLD
ncbi:PAS domain-containing protein [Thermaurantimonas aggregans]|uniref:PAS domain-containing protein n=1 Tax=Thermaurantimonas aggregans TaxID=2173829 RepID=UPI000F57C3F2|nr:PAS domain-containing protein [Thermaurantimonas aggregans]